MHIDIVLYRFLDKHNEIDLSLYFKIRFIYLSTINFNMSMCKYNNWLVSGFVYIELWESKYQKQTDFQDIIRQVEIPYFISRVTNLWREQNFSKSIRVRKGLSLKGVKWEEGKG